METIINYLLGADDGQRFDVDIRIGDHWIAVMRSRGVFHVSCEPMDAPLDEDVPMVTFTDKLDALEHIQNYVKGITNAA